MLIDKTEHIIKFFIHTLRFKDLYPQIYTYYSYATNNSLNKQGNSIKIWPISNWIGLPSDYNASTRFTLNIFKYLTIYLRTRNKFKQWIVQRDILHCQLINVKLLIFLGGSIAEWEKSITFAPVFHGIRFKVRRLFVVMTDNFFCFI